MAWLSSLFSAEDGEVTSVSWERSGESREKVSQLLGGRGPWRVGLSPTGMEGRKKAGRPVTVRGKLLGKQEEWPGGRPRYHVAGGVGGDHVGKTSSPVTSAQH